MAWVGLSRTNVGWCLTRWPDDHRLLHAVVVQHLAEVGGSARFSVGGLVPRVSGVREAGWVEDMPMAVDFLGECGRGVRPDTRAVIDTLAMPLR